jgi:hypothetical protein
VTVSANSRREHQWLLPLVTTGIKLPVRNPDLSDRERALVAVSSKVVTAHVATIRTAGGANSLHRLGKTLLIVPYTWPSSS